MWWYEVKVVHRADRGRVNWLGERESEMEEKQKVGNRTHLSTPCKFQCRNNIQYQTFKLVKYYAFDQAYTILN